MNGTLNKLLQGVLTGKPVDLRSCESQAQQRVESILTLLPLQLSRRQQQALRNAWSSDISYIQGPPGTGKSHTIAALMLSALLLNKRVLLFSHKKAAIDVVRAKLETVLGEELAIYVGTDTAERQLTRARIELLLAEVQSHTYNSELHSVRSQEQQVLESLRAALTQAETAERTLAGALRQCNAFYQAQREHLRTRRFYTDGFGPEDLSAQVLSAAPGVPMDWERVVNQLATVLAAMASGEPVPSSTLLMARMWLARYAEDYSAKWIRETPWDIHRLRAHFEAIASFDQGRRASTKITIDITRQRESLYALREQITQRSAAYLRLLFRRIQLEHAATSWRDLKNFSALFRLRAPHLLREKIAVIDYAKITTVFPLWLGEMRHLGSILPFQPDIFDLAVIDEASQVNIAEVVPAFYRAKSFVVVGDRKQLGLEAAGLFSVNRTFEELTWNNCFESLHGVINYHGAHQRHLAVSTSSILDFVTSDTNGLSVPKSTLDEHFRSMPSLASFTSNEFYLDDGGLKIMTEIGESHGKECFSLVETGGVRALDGKYVQAEVDKAIELVRKILNGSLLTAGSPLRALGFRHRDRLPSLGIVSFTTEQRDVLRLLLDEKLSDEERDSLDLFVGTPEEFQGNERDVIVLTFALGEGHRYAKSHYERLTRFNVATSRARKYTFAVIGRCPAEARLLRRYFGRFGCFPTRPAEVESEADSQTEPINPDGARMLWRLDERLCESEFEHLLLHCLQTFCDRHSVHRLKLYNQVNTCGQKRIDFVLCADDTGKSVAVEVDGQDHFCADGRTYHQEHLDRVATLRRAGWKLVHVPYYKWYRNGWLFDRDAPAFERVLGDLHLELRRALGITSAAEPRRDALPS